MRIIDSTPYGFPDKIELDDVISQDIIALMTKKPICPDEFYLTGYETISFKRTRAFALETVIASVVPFDKSLLILANHLDDLHIQNLCNVHGVNSTVIQLPDTAEDIKTLLASLDQERAYSHLLISCDVNRPACQAQIRLLACLLHRSAINLIVHCLGSPMDLREVNDLNIAYMICNGLSPYISSLVLARRSQLVQSEGVSRSSQQDLYSYWQKTLSSRHAAIRPMF